MGNQQQRMSEQPRKTDKRNPQRPETDGIDSSLTFPVFWYSANKWHLSESGLTQKWFFTHLQCTGGCHVDTNYFFFSWYLLVLTARTRLVRPTSWNRQGKKDKWIWREVWTSESILTINCKISCSTIKTSSCSLRKVNNKIKLQKELQWHTLYFSPWTYHMLFNAFVTVYSWLIALSQKKKKVNLR